MLVQSTITGDKLRVLHALDSQAAKSPELLYSRATQGLCYLSDSGVRCGHTGSFEAAANEYLRLPVAQQRRYQFQIRVLPHGHTAALAQCNVCENDASTKCCRPEASPFAMPEPVDKPLRLRGKLQPGDAMKTCVAEDIDAVGGTFGKSHVPLACTENTYTNLVFAPQQGAFRFSSVNARGERLSCGVVAQGEADSVFQCGASLDASTFEVHKILHRSVEHEVKDVTGDTTFDTSARRLVSDEGGSAALHQCKSRAAHACLSDAQKRDALGRESLQFAYDTHGLEPHLCNQASNTCYRVQST